MKPIGGFFELEIPERNNSYHEDALSFSTGRACLNYILQQSKPKKICLPYYTCDAVLEPIHLNKVKFEYYSLNDNLEPYEIELNENEYFLYINYFGIKTDIVQLLINRYGKRLIVDNSQGFFEKEHNGVWSFNSARKFFGVPDGAYLYSPISVSEDFPRNTGVKYDHLINRLLGNQELSYKQFLENERQLNTDLKLMSLLSERILSNINYEEVAENRIQNFHYLHENLVEINKFKISSNLKGVPYCYPFLPERVIDKKVFYKMNVFIPTLWRRSRFVVKNGYEFEKDFSERLLPLPVDQNLNKDDCNRIIESIIKTCSKN